MLYLLWSLYATAWVGVALALLLISKFLFDRLTPYSVDQQLTEHDNPAVGMVLSGFMLGIVAVIGGVFTSGDAIEEISMAQFLSDLIPVLIYAGVGIVLLLLSGIINDRALLHKFCNHKAITTDRNLGVAAVMAATYLGSGLVIAGGIIGSFSLLSALIAFALAQLGLVLYALLYQKLTSYDDLKEIGERKNTAAGVAFAGNLLAYSIILAKGVSMTGGAVETRIDRAAHFLYYALFGCLLLVVIRSVTDRTFLPKAKLSKEIVEDRNLSAGIMEAGLAFAAGLILAFCL